MMGQSVAQIHATRCRIPSNLLSLHGLVLLTVLVVLLLTVAFFYEFVAHAEFGEAVLHVLAAAILPACKSGCGVDLEPIDAWLIATLALLGVEGRVHLE